MAMSPSTLLAKLDELKRWQQTQQERLMRQHHQRLEETDRSSSSNFDSIPGLSAYTSYNRSNESNFCKNDSNVGKGSSFDSIKSTESEKSKQELLNECTDRVLLNQCKDQKSDKPMMSLDYEILNPLEKPVSSFPSRNKNVSTEKTILDRNENAIENLTQTASSVNLKNMPFDNKPSASDPEKPKPKRPYLKRGTGLIKFGMKPGDHKRPFNKMKPPQTAVHKRLAALRKEEIAKVRNGQDNGELERNKPQRSGRDDSDFEKNKPQRISQGNSDHEGSKMGRNGRGNSELQRNNSQRNSQGNGDFEINNRSQRNSQRGSDFDRNKALRNSDLEINKAQRNSQAYGEFGGNKAQRKSKDCSEFDRNNAQRNSEDFGGFDRNKELRNGDFEINRTKINSQCNSDSDRNKVPKNNSLDYSEFVRNKAQRNNEDCCEFERNKENRNSQDSSEFEVNKAQRISYELRSNSDFEVNNAQGNSRDYSEAQRTSDEERSSSLQLNFKGVQNKDKKDKAKRSFEGKVGKSLVEENRVKSYDENEEFLKTQEDKFENGKKLSGEKEIRGLNQYYSPEVTNLETNLNEEYLRSNNNSNVIDGVLNKEISREKKNEIEDVHTVQEGFSRKPVNFDRFKISSSGLNQSHKEITPLKVPEINVQPKGKWYAVDNNNELSEIPNNTMMECLKKLAEEKFGKNHDETAEILKDFESLNLDETPDLQKKLLECLEQLITGDNNTFVENNKKLVIDCLEELVGNGSDADTTSQRELQIFEQLEKRLMNSSFCSTNSSIFEMLSSTPFKRISQEPKSVHFENSRRNSVKRGLDFRDGHQSDESTVTSEDLNERTLPTPNFEETESGSTTSTSTVEEHRDVIVKQNACVMTDDLDFTRSFIAGDEVLKKRLKELDLEISKFRAENEKLHQMKSEVENERKELQKSRKKLEKEIQDERIRSEFELEEDRKKLAKEKLTFEKYMKDLQNKPSKKEREEISSLKAELANVKEVLKLKETRNGTTQARLRTQIKTLEKDNANLKEEVEKLQKQNAKLTAAKQIFRKTPSETKMLQEINKNLTKLTQDTKSVNNKEDSFEEKKRKKKKSFETEYRRSFGGCSEDDSNSDIEKSKRRSDSSKRSPELLRKNKGGESDSYKNKSSSRKSLESPEISRKNSIQEKSPDIYKSKSKTKLSRQKSLESPKIYRNISECHRKSESESETSESDEIPTKYSLKEKRSFADKTLNSRKIADTTSALLDKENDRNSTNCGDMTTFRNLSDLNIENNYDKVFGDKLKNNSLNDTQGSTSGKVVTTLEDGSTETKYQNGNMKTISPDGNFILVKFTNGDIKEMKLLDGSIRYYYAEHDLWQTTLGSGDEIYEYPDGQIEKHFIDGTTETTFPNGLVKITFKDGKEKINYPDGSVVYIDGNEKIIHLPNGQKEIHTKEHKRREYPDGTVKIIYPDGLQETRYSNGRIRMRNKDGNLLMDTHSDDI